MESDVVATGMVAVGAAQHAVAESISVLEAMVWPHITAQIASEPIVGNLRAHRLRMQRLRWRTVVIVSAAQQRQDAHQHQRSVEGANGNKIVGAHVEKVKQVFAARALRENHNWHFARSANLRT